MKTALNHSERGMQRARAQVNLATSRIARWGLNTDSSEAIAADTEPGALPVDEVRLDGIDRPRNILNQRWGGRGPDGLSPEVDLSEEAIRLKSGEWAFRANIAATRSVLDLQKITSDLLEPDKK